MRLIVTLFILLLSVSACKKDSDAENVDPRDQYLGTYDVDYSSKTVIASAIDFSEDSGKGNITFTKGDAPNELKMAVIFDGFSSTTDVVKLSGTAFTMTRTRDQLSFGNKVYDAEFAGSGLFEGKNMTLTSVTKMNQSGTVVQWTRTYKGLKR
jgi:hypothetical protein